MTQHIICYSGGHSSALTAIEVVRRYGSVDVTLLNHDINPRYEDPDIKRFKAEVAAHLELPITYANLGGIEKPEEIPSQFIVCMTAKATGLAGANGFKFGSGSELCTHGLKTKPFTDYLKANHPQGSATIYYGFDANEMDRVHRRRRILSALGYGSAYPRAEWRHTIESTTEIGITPPLTYAQYKHANCVGCLKAGKQHWYVVYCTRPDVWAEAKAAEAYIGYTIHPGESLESLEPLFDAMQLAGITPTEHIPQQRFWADVNKFVKPKETGLEGFQNTLFMQMPCECVV